MWTYQAIAFGLGRLSGCTLLTGNFSRQYIVNLDPLFLVLVHFLDLGLRICGRLRGTEQVVMRFAEKVSIPLTIAHITNIILIILK